jgi:hypothetical protein
VLSQTYASKHWITIINNRSQWNLNKIFSDRREKMYKYQNPQTQKGKSILLIDIFPYN